MASVDDCKLFEIRSVLDRRGVLAFVEGGIDVGFEIRRVYWMFDIPSRTTRAGHAHRTLRQLYVAVSGSFDVALDDGRRVRRVHLSRPDQGLILGPGIWREIDNFSSNACLLVLASELFDEADYVRDRAQFQQLVDAGSFG
jgi:WxcM-like, C-terminal